MVKHAQLVRIKKLKGDAIVEVAAKHNLREIAAEIGGYGDIDGRRVPLNYTLRGADTSEGVASAARLLMEQAGIKKPRKDAVRGLEIVFSLRPNSTIDAQAFFRDSLGWAANYFANAPIVSAVVHCDESAPHCHVIILPIVDGCLRGSELMGNKRKLQSMQADFNGKVGERYGLTYSAPRKRAEALKAPDAAVSVIEEIKARPERLNEPELRDAMLVAIDYNREAILLALKQQASDIKPIGFEPGEQLQQKANSIGFDEALDAAKMQSLSCVGFQLSEGNSAPAKTRKKGSAQAKAERVIELLAAGFTKQEVADSLGMGIASVYRIVATPKNANNYALLRKK
jgi:hypothetical protein